MAKYAKKITKCKKQKVCSGVFYVTFLRSAPRFFHFSQHFAPGLTFVRKVKGFRGLFFRGINKT